MSPQEADGQAATTAATSTGERAPRSTGTPTRRRRGRPRRSPEERAAQRRRLILSTIEAIGNEGPDISIDDLAAGVGVSKPVLYDEFGDKTGIADAIAVHLAEELERTVFERLGLTDGEIAIPDLTRAIDTVIDALVDLVLREPEVYLFIVRSIRVSDRGFLDNALVRAIHRRARFLVTFVAPDAAHELVDVLVDGLFGFVFASLESWTTDQEPDRATVVHALSVVIHAGIQSVADEL